MTISIESHQRRERAYPPPLLNYAPARVRRTRFPLLHLLAFTGWLMVLAVLLVQVLICAIDWRSGHTLTFRAIVVISLYLWMVGLPTVAGMALGSRR